MEIHRRIRVAPTLPKSVPRDMIPRPSATVMVIRDGPRGLETFMLRRRLEMAFVPGAHVFPGGAVDVEDGFDDVAECCEGLTDEAASRMLGVDGGGLAYWVAAVREAFEEVGVLFAQDRTGAMVSLDHDDHAARFRAHRRGIDQGSVRLAQVCRAEGLGVAVDAIRYFGRWVTPEGAPKRFDTRFFVAPVPASQTLEHEPVESLSGQWVRPADALGRHAEGHWDLILPTQRSLELIGRFDRVADLIAAVDAVQSGGDGDAAVVTSDSGGWRVRLPGDVVEEVAVVGGAGKP